jgi:hypothetical protein
MKEFKFAGQSDDTFGEDTPCGMNYDNCASGEPIIFRLNSPSTEQQLLVVGQYNNTGNACWTIGITSVNEDIPVPENWKYRFGLTDREYSPQLSIECPDDTELECLNIKDDDDD